MKLSNIQNYAAVFVLLLSACAAETGALVPADEQLTSAEAVITGVKESYAPDKRVALFDIRAGKLGDQLVLRGESDLPQAVDSLKVALEARNLPYLDSIQLLPEAGLEGKTYGIVRLSVANLRSEPKHSAELATQATLGTPLKVLKKKNGWQLVQTPDGYLSWVDDGGLVSLDKAAFSSWQAAEKLIYMKPYGFSYESSRADAATVSDLVMGSILELSGQEKGFYQVKYPDGTTAHVAKEEAQPYHEWLAALKPSGNSLVSTSFTLKGLPYLWGGTSFKGVDCSGFTKTVYFLNGIVIPRDASQQIHTGQLVDATREFDKLLPGDLLFFGRAATDSTSERVIHVGMWIGNNEFIHSAGNVHISSVDSTAEHFDRYNYNRYLRSKRLLQQDDARLIQLSKQKLF